MKRELTNGAEVIQQAREAWGDETARAVLGRVISSIFEADEVITPPTPVDRIQIQIADIPECHPSGVPAPRMAGLHTQFSSFSLLLDRSSPERVMCLTKSVVTHETARVAVYQHRLGVHYKTNRERSVLDTFVEDGMVVNALEMALSPEDYVESANFMSYDLDNDVVHKYIQLYIEKSMQPHDRSIIRGLRFGDATVSRPGYRVGHAIVRSAINTYDLSLQEMLRQSPQFYADHAAAMVGV